MVTIACFFLLLLGVARANFRVNPYLHGSARWADARDIKAAGLINNDGVYVGAWRDKSGNIRYLRHAGPEHVLCYAPTRSGKGVGLIVPTLLSWKPDTPFLKYIDVSTLPLDANGQVRPELFVEDKLHFNAAGNKLLAEKVRPYLPKP
jgi:hypothetical protein